MVPGGRLPPHSNFQGNKAGAVSWLREGKGLELPFPKSNAHSFQDAGMPTSPSVAIKTYFLPVLRGAGLHIPYYNRPSSA